MDDHPVIRSAMVSVIGRQSDFELCGQSADAPTGLHAIAECRPDLVTVGLSLENSSGLDLIKDLICLHAAVRILAISADDDPDVAMRAMRAGARGVFLIKHDPMGNFAPAIRRVLSGKRYVTPPLDEMLLTKFLDGAAAGSPRDRLSDRELDVVRLLAGARETKEIAALLHISDATVGTYYDRIKQKLGVHTERELIVAAVHLMSSPR